MNKSILDRLPFQKSSSPLRGGGTGLSGTTQASATLLGGFPITIPLGVTDVTNQDCTVISDGVHPVLLFAQAGFLSTGAGLPTVTLEIREGVTVIESTATDKPGASGTTMEKITLHIGTSIVLSAGTHTLKLSIRKDGSGSGQCTSGTGDKSDTFLRAVY